MSYFHRINKKSLIFALTFLFYSNFTFCQLLPGGIDQDEKEKNFDNELKPSVSIVFKIPYMLNEWGIEFGGKFLVPIIDNFSLGLGYYQLLTHNLIINPSESITMHRHLRLGYGGLEFNYSFNVVKPIKISLSSLLAIGNISYGFRNDIDIPGDISGDWIFLAEPSIFIFFEIGDVYSLAFGSGFRKSLGVNLLNLNDNSLTGLVLTVLFNIKL